MNRAVQLACAAALGLGSIGTASAAATFDVWSDVKLTVVELKVTNPSGIAAPTGLGIDSEAFGDSYHASYGDADSAASTKVKVSLSGLTLSANVNGSISGALSDLAFADAIASGSVGLTNSSQDDYEVTFRLDYDTEGQVSATGVPTEYALAETWVVVDSLVDGELVNLYFSADTWGGNLSFAETGSKFFSLLLPAGSSDWLTLDNGTSGLAVAAVPVPAALPLFLSAVALTAGLARRRQRNA